MSRSARRRIVSKRRAGNAVRRRLRSEQRAFLLKNPRRFGLVIFVGAVTALVVAALQSTPFMKGFAGGFITASTVALIWYGLAIHFLQRDMGATAEEWTTQALRKLDRKSWSVIDDIPFEDGNVDHVVVGPGRIYAVETKWMSNSGRDGVWAKSAASQAAASAGRIRRLLRSIGLEREVVPVLVIWGDGAKPFEGRRQFFGDTRVVSGYVADDWRGRMAASGRGEFDGVAYNALVGYVERRVSYERQNA